MTTHNTDVYIGLGSNLHDPLDQLQRAIDTIATSPQVTLICTSSFYRNPPMGPQCQPDFINAVSHINTSLRPHDLLHFLKTIEQQHNRQETVRWGPRTLDLDILTYGDEIIDDNKLTIPHPGLADRLFVLVPLYELNPAFILPNGGSLKQKLNCMNTGTLIPVIDDITK